MNTLDKTDRFGRPHVARTRTRGTEEQRRPTTPASAAPPHAPPLPTPSVKASPATLLAGGQPTPTTRSSLAATGTHTPLAATGTPHSPCRHRHPTPRVARTWGSTSSTQFGDCAMMSAFSMAALLWGRLAACQWPSCEGGNGMGCCLARRGHCPLTHACTCTCPGARRRRANDGRGELHLKSAKRPSEFTRRFGLPRRILQCHPGRPRVWPTGSCCLWEWEW